jgi:hypothetical protein
LRLIIRQVNNFVPQQLPVVGVSKLMSSKPDLVEGPTSPHRLLQTPRHP